MMDQSLNRVQVNSEETFVDSKVIRATVLKELMKTAKAQDVRYDPNSFCEPKLKTIILAKKH